jgi:signal transduction histidine kinase
MTRQPNDVHLTAELAKVRDELRQALERERATGEILRVIAGAHNKLDSMLEAVLENAIRLCDGSDAIISEIEGDRWRVLKGRGPLPRMSAGDWVPIDRGSVTGRAMLDLRPVHVHDVLADSTLDFAPSLEIYRQYGAGTMLAVPLVRDGVALGAITLWSSNVRPYSDQRIKLVQTFADQAAIAIENARLFNELQASNGGLRESLEQQTALGEILRVMSSSLTDLQRVLDTIAASAARLCQTDFGRICRLEGGELRFVAAHGTSLPRLDAARSFPIEGTVSGRAVRERRTIQVEDAAALGDDLAQSRAYQRLGGHRTYVATPLLLEGQAIGVLIVGSMQVRPLTDQQIKLLETFADQAVIAFENTRLFQELAIKNRELELASQHKSQFLANMSHELRTPLNAILGYTELIVDGIYGQPPERIAEVLGRVEQSGRHLLGLINAVLDLSKMEAGQLQLSLGEYRIKDVVYAVLSALEPLAVEKGLKLEAVVADDLPGGLGDEARLRQVLLNLVGNALKFTETGSVQVSAKVEGGELQVAVKDSGPGISEAHRARIFEEFQQAEGGTVSQKGGTGLGLSIARRIVELHGGRIGVESTVGEGSTFAFRVPVRVRRPDGQP